MVNKFKTATKRITAIAASAAIVSSTAFAGGLNNYPSNFVTSGQFNGQVIVGASAATSDVTAAESIIEDLKAEFSGSSSKVKLTAKKSSGASGTSLSAVKSNKALNFGDSVGSVSEQGNGFDDGNTNILSDETFTNGASNEDYTQRLKLENGNFNYALRDNVDGVTKIQDGVYYANGDTYATYTFDLKTAINVEATPGSMTSSEKANFVGKTLTLMGVDYTISDIRTLSGSGVDKLELIGGANKITLGEGESTTVTVGDKSYEVMIQSVSGGSGTNNGKVLLSINGKSRSVDELNTETIDGISVAVTDLVASNRDSVKGYAEVVIGGQKILLDNGNVKINDQDVNNLYQDYNVDVTFNNPDKQLNKFTITYKVDNDVLLKKGDSLIDPLFKAFNVRYDGTNDVTYSDMVVRTNDDDIEVSGTLLNGASFNQPVVHTVKSGNNAGATYMVGNNNGDRILFKDSLNTIGVANGTVTGSTGTVNIVADMSGESSNAYSVVITAGATPAAGSENVSISNNVITVLANTASNATQIATAINAEATVNTLITATAGTAGVVGTVASTSLSGGIGGIQATTASNKWTLDSSNTNIKGDGFLVKDASNNDDQYLYEVQSISAKTGNNNDEVDFNELLQNRDKQNVIFSQADFANAFEISLSGITAATPDKVILDKSTTTQLSDIIAFKDQALLTFGATTEVVDLREDTGSTGSVGAFRITYDNTDLDFKDLTSAPAIDITYNWDTIDTEFNLKLSNATANFVNDNLADNVISNSNDQTYVTSYGTKVAYDNNDQRTITISTPDKEVQGKVSLVFGDAGNTETKTYTVDASAADAKVSELEADGYTVTKETVSSEKVTFDISAPVLDSSVSSVSDAIVVGGPAVNSAARELLGISTYTIDQAGVSEGEAIARYFANSNSVLVYGYSAADTTSMVEKLNKGTANIQ